MAPLRSPALHPAAVALRSILESAQRVSEIPAIGWLWGVMSGAMAILGHDPFTLIFLITAAATLLDYSFGVRAVKDLRPDEYDPAKRARGRDQKVISLSLLILLRLIEWWASRHHVLDLGAILRLIQLDSIARAPLVAQGGIITVVITAALCVDELRSMHEHRVALGGKPIRMLLLLFGATDKLQDLLEGRVRGTSGAAETGRVS